MPSISIRLSEAEYDAIKALRDREQPAASVTGYIRWLLLATVTNR